MKRCLIVLLCLVLAFGVSGCAEYEQLAQSIQQAAQAAEQSAAPESAQQTAQIPEAKAPEESVTPVPTQSVQTVDETTAPTAAPEITPEPTAKSTDAPIQAAKTASESILEYFTELTKIPRASHHEEEVSTYLYNWGIANSLTTEKDAVGNVIIDLPASTNFENAPLTVLQAHMDMVAVAAPGISFNALIDGVTLEREGNDIHAKGTSLGADDGIGVATAMYVLSSEELEHGPIRVIFTVNEEDGMSGAAALDAKYLSDAVYLINLDNENVAQAIIGCAYGSVYSMNFTPAWKAPEGDTAYEITVSGLLGGHSGICINMGRANAIKMLSGILARAFNAGIMPEIAQISGGSANNSIPSAASVTVVIRDADTETFEKIVTEQRIAAQERYGKIETSASFSATKLNAIPQKVLYGPVGRSLTEFLFLCPDGVNSMNARETDSVESSSNLGVLKLDENELSATVYTRSERKCITEEQEAKLSLLSSMCGAEMRKLSEMPGWTPDEENPLAAMAAELYQAQTGKEMQILSVHAGLECGWLASKKPELCCVSLGPNIHDPHTPQERVEVESIADFMEILEAMLIRIAAE